MFFLLSPFVDGSLGRDNYKFFIGLLIMHPIAYIGFVIATFYFFYRDHISWLYWLFLLYSMSMCLMLQGLLNYHIRLSTKNLTTNEDINIRKYPYLFDRNGDYSNPFDNGSRCGNFMEVFFADCHSYYSRDEVLIKRKGGVKQ
jgi:hypothetical protein